VVVEVKKVKKVKKVVRVGEGIKNRVNVYVKLC